MYDRLKDGQDRRLSKTGVFCNNFSDADEYFGYFEELVHTS